MYRRSFLKSLAAAPVAGLVRPRRLEASLPKAKITKVSIYAPPNANLWFNQSAMLVTVETDIGITGVGEGGTKDTLEACARKLIGQNPFHIERLWHEMFVFLFYPPGRERIHAQGAMDLALWDIKGKALKLPVHEVMGGTVRNHVECYATANVKPGGAAGTGAQGGDPFENIRRSAEATMAAGYRVYRTGVGFEVTDNMFNAHEQVRLAAQVCKAAREGVGSKGDFSIDFHQRLDYIDALRLCKLIEEYAPYLVEDPVRDERALEDIPRLRQMTTCPLAHGEEWGHRWEFNKLIENHDIDYIRVPVNNVGGITEMMKVAALCETHSVGIVPHFTGPVATAAQVNCLSTFSGPVLFEYNFGDRPIPYLPECLDFKNGKLYTNDRPGLGVTVDMKPLKLISEITTPMRGNFYQRPDGSVTHW